MLFPLAEAAPVVFSETRAVNLRWIQMSLAGLCLLSGPRCGASLLAPWVGPNTRLGEDPAELPGGDGLNQAEPHVARSVAEPDLLLATFQEGRYSDGGARSNGYAVSEDGGFTWRRSLIPRLTQTGGGSYYRAPDPVAAISADGILYLNSLVSVDSSFALGRLVLQRSTDRGVTWSDPRTIYTGIKTTADYGIFPDKNWMAVNDFAGPTEGRVVVTWTNFRTDTREFTLVEDALITLSYSDDRGQTWSSPLYVTPPQGPTLSRVQYQGSQPVFLPGGGLAIVCHNFRRTRLELHYSPDGGESFPFPEVPLHDSYILYDAPNLRDGSFLPSAGAARETGDIYVAYVSRDSPGDTFGHVYFIRSDRPDSGPAVTAEPDWSFRPPVRISGDAPSRVTCLPTLAVSPDGRVVTVSFYDNRNGDSGNSSGDFYCVQSFDGGESWTDPFRLSGQTFPLDKATATPGGYMIGDYFGLAPPGGPGQAAVAVWIDTRLESADPWSARIAGGADSVFEEWLQAWLPFGMREPGPSLLRYRDSDRDGAPNFLEYLTGHPPARAQPAPSFADGLALPLLAPGTDPETGAVVAGGTGRWPAAAQASVQVPVVSPVGEGYWNEHTWPQGGSLQHLRFTINNSLDWYLLEESAPVRWILDRGRGWIWSPWLGYLYTSEAPWLYHPSLGWVYDLGPVLFSPFLERYLFPSPATWPWMATADGSALYVLPDGPLVYDPVAEIWIQTR